MTWLIPVAVSGVALLQYFGGNDLVHALSEEEGAEIGYPRRSRKAGKARGSAEQRPAVTGELAKSSLTARLCSRSVCRPIAIGLQAARRVRVVPIPTSHTRLGGRGFRSENVDTTDRPPEGLRAVLVANAGRLRI